MPPTIRQNLRRPHDSMKKFFFIILNLCAITCFSQNVAVLEEVTLSDRLMRISMDTLAMTRCHECISAEKVPYFVFDYYPATLAEDEFQIGIYPAFLSREEFSNLGYYFIIQGVPYVLSRDIPGWLYHKTGNSKVFIIAHKEGADAVSRYIPWIIIKCKNHTRTITTHNACSCGDGYLY